MTKEKMEEVRELVLALIQREVNGHPYVTIVAESIAHCGGWQLVISDIPLFHDNDVLGIIAVCASCCVTFQLYLNEGRIVLI